MTKSVNIAYIGGGSKEWARVFISDLALTEGLGTQPHQSHERLR